MINVHLEQWVRWINSWLLENNYLKNYPKQLFCQAIKTLFQSTAFPKFFVLVNLKWLIVNIVQTSIKL